MLTVGCAGFPVPATRYFREFMFVEVQETHVSNPGPGTIRRWKREAPDGFRFALLGPRDVGQEGFREGKVIETALRSLDAVAEELEATTAVFTAPPDFVANRVNKGMVREFLQVTRPRYGRIIFEAGAGWDPDECDELAQEVGVIAARDPLVSGLSKLPTAYYRLHGPAGRKSRYEDPAIERLADLAKGAKHHKDATYVFTNVDMFADAKRFKKSAGVK